MSVRVMQGGTDIGVWFAEIAGTVETTKLLVRKVDGCSGDGRR